MFIHHKIIIFFLIAIIYTCLVRVYGLVLINSLFILVIYPLFVVYWGIKFFAGSFNNEKCIQIEKYKPDVIQNKPYIIGICGASGSGKTYISNLIVNTTNELFKNISDGDIIVLNQDSYYKSGNDNTNFDVPDAIDFDLLQDHLELLINGCNIDCPIYDFTTHSRKNVCTKISPGKIIIVEGILIFTQIKLRNLFNMKIFVDAEEPTQIFRRAIRDINERNRTIEEVKLRYERDVWPSYKQYVQPSSKYADIVINNYNDCFVGPRIILNHIIHVLKNLYDTD